jgi:hypothetical protein
VSARSELKKRNTAEGELQEQVAAERVSGKARLPLRLGSRLIPCSGKQGDEAMSPSL